MPINCEVVQWSESVQWHLAWILEDPTAELLGEAHQNTTRVPVHNTLTNTRLSSPFNEGLLNRYVVYKMEHQCAATHCHHHKKQILSSVASIHPVFLCT